MITQSAKELRQGDIFTSDKGETWFRITNSLPNISVAENKITWQCVRVNDKGDAISLVKLISFNLSDELIVKI